MSVLEEHQDVITTVLILMEAIIVLAWMDMNCNQIITLVQVMIMFLPECVGGSKKAAG